MAGVEEHLQRVTERVGTSYFGKYRGIVSRIDDGENRCRIKAKVPAIFEDYETGWAEAAVALAGDGYGMVMLPKPKSDVWIEFEAGNLDRPIWTGAWWRAGGRPAPKGDEVYVIVSGQKHQVVIDDESNELRLVHASGPKITITADAIILSCGACELKIGMSAISLNDGQIKVGNLGVSLAQGAMSFGVPPP